MPITLGELMEKHIKPDHHVAFIGPYNSVFHDPSAFASSMITSRGKGRTWIVDFQSQVLKNSLKRIPVKDRSEYQKKLLAKLKSLWGKGAGVGDYAQYRKSVKMLSKKFGWKVKPPYPMLANASKMDFKDKELDVLVDAGSLHFASMGLKQLSTALLIEYKRVAKKVILLDDYAPSLSSMKREFEQLGAKKVDLVEASNKYVFRTNCAKPIADVATPVRLSSDLGMPSFKQALSVLPEAKELHLSHSYAYKNALVIEF